MCFKKQFKANPRKFMEDNIVTCPDNPGFLPANKIVKITLEKSEFGTISNKPTGNVYTLIFADTEDSIEAYWCPYANNNVGTVMLGTDARYVFTVSMNACSFGVGSYSSPGVVRVAHANAASAANSYGIGSTADIVPAMTQQSKIQQHQLYSEDASTNIISFNDYMATDGQFNQRYRATTFGELSADLGQWKFYTLMYINGAVMEHKGVVEQL